MRKLRFVCCLQTILWKKNPITSQRLFYNFLQKKETKYEKLEMFCGWHVKINKAEGEGMVMRGDKQQWLWFITMILLSMELQQFRL